MQRIKIVQAEELPDLTIEQIDDYHRGIVLAIDSFHGKNREDLLRMSAAMLMACTRISPSVVVKEDTGDSKEEFIHGFLLLGSAAMIIISRYAREVKGLKEQIEALAQETNFH